MKQIAELTVGDEVLIVPTYREDAGGTPGTVVKVARVWLTVQTGQYHTEKFRRDTGIGAGDPAGWRITTPELVADSRRREELRTRLRAFGIDTYRLSHKVSTNLLEQIVEVIESEATDD